MKVNTLCPECKKYHQIDVAIEAMTVNELSTMLGDLLNLPEKTIRSNGTYFYNVIYNKKGLIQIIQAVQELKNKVEE